jgi:RNA ligase (TIGR02306 family)
MWQRGQMAGSRSKRKISAGDLCTVYLPDSIIPPSEELKFMEKSNWRVKMQRFRGAPSEVLIVPLGDYMLCEVGLDLTELLGVTKYYKPISPHLQGIAKGPFPDFLPKTDELNYQMHGELVDALVGKAYYISEKCDGSSTTAYRYKGTFGICSRNLELERNYRNGYWLLAEKYKVEENLPEGVAIQWETCGPKIQGNPMGLSEIEAFMFSAYDIDNHRYFSFDELKILSRQINFPTVKILKIGYCFSKEGLESMGEGLYSNGNQREGVVIRSQYNVRDHCPISFKVINLDYES